MNAEKDTIREEESSVQTQSSVRIVSFSAFIVRRSLLSLFAAAIAEDGAERFDRVREQVRASDAAGRTAAAQVRFHHGVALVAHRDRAFDAVRDLPVAGTRDH